MTQPRSRPDRIGRLLSGLARQLDLPFFGGGAATQRDTGLRGRPPSSPPSPPSRRSATPAPPAADPRRRSIRLEDGPFDYTLRRARRKTIGFSISVEGLTVSAPRWVGVRQIDAAIRGREAWILTKLADLRRHHASIPRVRWEDGGTLPYLGAPITLRVAERGRSGTRGPLPSFDRESRSLVVPLPAGATAEQMKARVQAWLQAEARALFRERLAFYEARAGVTHRALRLSSARTRWGSCSADGRILLNWRLIHFPLASIDYVVAHELAHLTEMNHGARFWATVASILPGYEAAREQVKDPPPEWLPTL